MPPEARLPDSAVTPREGLVRRYPGHGYTVQPGSGS